jgi:HTH-type transcriptional repressor of puuD
MNPAPPSNGLVIRANQIQPFDRGSGVVTMPYVGKWNSPSNGITTGITVLQPGAGVPLHFHNVDEAVLVVEGEATATIAQETFELGAGDATWVPKRVPHCFVNMSDGQTRIYWVYAGRDVTRTLCSTGQTVEHLSADDRVSGTA